MKAFEVSYDTADCSTSTLVLTENEDTLAESLALKDKNFVIGDIYSRISWKKEIPLINVMVKDLTVMELVMLMNTLKADSVKKGMD